MAVVLRIRYKFGNEVINKQSLMDLRFCDLCVVIIHIATCLMTAEADLMRNTSKFRERC